MNYQPRQGDIVIANLNSTDDCKKQRKQPVLIVSNHDYYRLTGLLIVCPISQADTDFPMHLPLPSHLKTKGAVLTQHLRTIDPLKREISFLEKIPIDIFKES